MTGRAERLQSPQDDESAMSGTLKKQVTSARTSKQQARKGIWAVACWICKTLHLFLRKSMWTDFMAMNFSWTHEQEWLVLELQHRRQWQDTCNLRLDDTQPTGARDGERGGSICPTCFGYSQHNLKSPILGSSQYQTGVIKLLIISKIWGGAQLNFRTSAQNQNQFCCLRAWIKEQQCKKEKANWSREIRGNKGSDKYLNYLRTVFMLILTTILDSSFLYADITVGSKGGTTWRARLQGDKKILATNVLMSL